MKKTFMLGKTAWSHIFIISIVGTIIFLVCFTLSNQDVISINQLIKFILVILVLIVICFPFMQGINARIEILEDKIILKTFFAEKKIYYKKDLKISYAIQKHRGRGAYTSSCLVIGFWISNTICYTKKRLVYNDYFLVLLDYKKLMAILAWYNQEIRLPARQELNNFKSKEIRKFYEMIEQYNLVVLGDNQ